MIIGFLGKGGSGKTTLATMYTKYLLNKKNFSDYLETSFGGNKVIALDNDHNMDFKFNLGYERDMNAWMGQSLQDIFDEIAITATKDVENIEDDYVFSLSPKDKITQKYSATHTIKNDDNVDSEIDLMVSGPHTEAMMYGNMCSHGLTTPLKVYLPLLKLNDYEYVIVDEKAGTDGVGTGVTTGFNAAVVVAEATMHGVKAAKQIIDMLRFYNTPYIVAINKIRESDMDGEICKYDKDFESSDTLDILHFRLDIDTIDLKTNDEYKKEFKKLYTIVNKLNDNRKERTKERIRRQKDYNDSNI